MEDGVAVPEDVLIEILVNLPIKSLSRFRCVSKYWCHLIKSRNFVSRHLNHDCKETFLVINKLPGTEGGRRRDVFSFHDPESLDLLVSPNLSIPDFWDNSDGEPFFDFLGLCNGLVCLAFHTMVILCNPALREFELLPPTPFDCSEDYQTSCCATAFGFDAINDAYKVVRLWNTADREKYFAEDYDFEDSGIRIDLYDSRTNSWRLIDAAVPMAHADGGSNLFFNGACHWYTQPVAILSFNLSTEVFRCFDFPHLGDSVPTLGILNQCLAVFCLRGLLIDPGQLAEEQPVDIWVMKEYGVKESWTKEFVIGPYAIGRPILLWNNEWLLAETEHLLVSWALHGNEIRRSHVNANYESVLVAIFKESLVSLKQVIHGNT